MSAGLSRCAAGCTSRRRRAGAAPTGRCEWWGTSDRPTDAPYAAREPPRRPSRPPKSGPRPPDPASPQRGWAWLHRLQDGRVRGLLHHGPAAALDQLRDALPQQPVRRITVTSTTEYLLTVGEVEVVAAGRIRARDEVWPASDW